MNSMIVRRLSLREHTALRWAQQDENSKEILCLDTPVKGNYSWGV